jgi:hypothetical protein
MNSIKGILIFLIFSSSAFCQQNNVQKSIKLEKLAINYYLNKKYDSLLIYLKEAEKLRSNHPRLLYNIASAYSLNNDRKDALSELQNLVDMKLFFSPEKDSDFVSLWNDNEFKNIINGFNKNLIHTGNSDIAFTYPEKDLITESVAFDSVTKKFFLSSVYRRKIVTIDRNNKTEDFVSEGEDSLWSVFGIKVDSGRRILWACTGAIKQTKNYNENDLGKTAVFKYDIDSKKLLKKYELDNKEDEHLFGDLTLSSTGDVYVSESKFNAVYKIPAGSDSLEMFLAPKESFSLQGLDLSPDGNYLFLSDYGLGLFKINLETKEIEKIKSSPNLTTLGIDGLYFYKNSVIATQNGINPQRVVRIYLNDDMNKIGSYKILESNNPYFEEITLGMLKGDEFYFIANGQWGSFDKSGKIFQLSKLKKPVVLKIKLTAN